MKKGWNKKGVHHQSPECPIAALFIDDLIPVLVLIKNKHQS
jgi:hypothetical protein